MPTGDSQDVTPRFYRDFAEWWPLFSSPAEYAEEADFYRRVLVDNADTPPKTVLELGCGGGNNASYLKQAFEMTLVDPSRAMLKVSRALNPECEHLEGDMRSLRLGRRFGAVFVHDAVSYMQTESDLRAAITTAVAHCEPGGVVVFAPDDVVERYTPSTSHGGNDDGRRGLRYLEWTWDPDPADSTCIVDYAFALRDEDGSVQVVHDRHIEGLFSRNDWIRLLEEAGCAAQGIPFEHSEFEEGVEMEVFVGKVVR